MKQWMSIVVAISLSAVALQADITSGLVAHYEFEGNANDSSGNGNNGAEYGGVSYVTGKIGQAVSFDGVDDYINAGDLPNHKTSTFSLWIKTTNSDRQAVIGDYIWSSYTDGFFISINHDDDGSHKVWAYTSNYPRSGGGRSDVISDSISVSDGDWHNLIAVTSNEKLSLYIDGDLIGHDDISYAVSDNDFLIGNAEIDPAGSSYGENTKIKGYIDDLRIYNRALNSSEITELYECEVAGNCSSCDTTTPYNSGYEAGKAYCIANPSACGLAEDTPPEIEECSEDSFSISSGWNMLGSSNALNVTTIYDTYGASAIWIYSQGQWSKKTAVTNSIGTSIPKNQGFWLKK